MMATRITDVLMTSDQTPHSAQWSQHAAADGQGAWVVSWLPLRLLTRDQAITAMTLAEVATTGDLSPTGQWWLFVEGWADELGLTAQRAVELLAATTTTGQSDDVCPTPASNSFPIPQR